VHSISIILYCRSGLGNRHSFNKSVPRCSQDDSVVSYGHYDVLTRKDRCFRCCDREIEKKYWSDSSFHTLPSHHRTNEKSIGKWISLIQSSKMLRIGGRFLLVLIFVSVLGVILGRSSSSRVSSDSDNIHLGEEAKLVMVGISEYQLISKYSNKTALRTMSCTMS
jgi:hypothetical protein